MKAPRKDPALLLFDHLAQLPEVMSSDATALRLRAVSPWSKGWAIVVHLSTVSLRAALNSPGNRAVTQLHESQFSKGDDSDLVLQLRDALQTINLGTHELFLRDDGKTFMPGLPYKLPPFRAAESDLEPSIHGRKSPGFATTTQPVPDVSRRTSPHEDPEGGR